jgi:hypothetical protein
MGSFGCFAETPMGLGLFLLEASGRTSSCLRSASGRRSTDYCIPDVPPAHQSAGTTGPLMLQYQCSVNGTLWFTMINNRVSP